MLEGNLELKEHKYMFSSYEMELYSACKGNERKSTCLGCTGEPGQFPAPSPLSPLHGAGVGGGEGMAGRVLPGDPKWGRGVTLASQYGELESHLILARKIHGWSRT